MKWCKNGVKSRKSSAKASEKPLWSP